MTKTIDITKEKRDMMELWKETFHDSNRYIKLVFDTYYRPENAFTVYDGDKLVASLLGVEYEFQRKDKEGIKKNFQGLYLCGLATHPDYRRRGIMGELMEQAENSAKRRGNAITFLIPADDHLRRYYEGKGYKTSSFRIKKPLEKAQNADKSKMYIYTFKELFELNKNDFIEEVAEWCRNRELESRALNSILHSQQDMLAVIRENENSFFVTDSSFDLKYPILAKVRAVVFPSLIEGDSSEIWGIDGLFLKENQEYNSQSGDILDIPQDLSQIIQEKYPNREFILRTPISNQKIEIMKSQPYAMVKSLVNDGEFAKFENQVFKIYLMLD